MYAAMTKDEAQRSIRTFYEAVKTGTVTAWPVGFINGTPPYSLMTYGSIWERTTLRRWSITCLHFCERMCQGKCRQRLAGEALHAFFACKSLRRGRKYTAIYDGVLRPQGGKLGTHP